MKVLKQFLVGRGQETEAPAVAKLLVHVVLTVLHLVECAGAIMNLTVAVLRNEQERFAMGQQGNREVRRPRAVLVLQDLGLVAQIVELEGILGVGQMSPLARPLESPVDQLTPEETLNSGVHPGKQIAIQETGLVTEQPLISCFPTLVQSWSRVLLAKNGEAQTQYFHQTVALFGTDVPLRNKSQTFHWARRLAETLTHNCVGQL